MTIGFRGNKLLRLLFLTAFFLLLAGCRKNELEVEFNLSPDINVNYNVTYYARASSGGATVQAVAPVMEGKYLLKVITNKPTLLFITARQAALPLVVYAERGEHLKVTGEEADPLLWNVEGNSINRTISEWRLALGDTLTSGSPAMVNAAVKNFIYAHPSDPASTVILLAYFDRAESEDDYSELWGSLRNEARDLKWARLFGRSDQPGPRINRPARLHSMALRGLGGKTEILNLDSARAALLFFWHPQGSLRREIIDSLKSLSKEYPDSSRRVIADICLEADSTAWRNTIRRDSLSGVTSLWAPQGMADYNFMKLGVTKSPMLIVTDSAGVQIYRGADIKRASEEFRLLMQEADTTDNRR